MRHLSIEKGVALTLNFYASLITFEGTRHNWKKLLLPVNRELKKKNSQMVNVVSGDRHALSEISSLEVFLYQCFVAVLTVRWKRLITRSLEKNKSARRDYFDCLVEVLSGIRSNAFSALRQPQKFRKRALRVLNISELHRQAISSGLESRANWLITLEDDGLLIAGAPLGAAFDFILQSVPSGDLAVFDISDSFTFEQLGVEHIVVASDRVPLGATGQEVVKARVPFTNTLCATVMSRAFAIKWGAYVEQSLSTKVIRLIPIDWLLNRFILKEFREKPLDYFHFDPGLIRQGSIAP